MKKIKNALAVLVAVTTMAVSLTSVFAENKEVIANYDIFGTTIVVKNMDVQQCNEMYEQKEQYYLDNCKCLDYYFNHINEENNNALVLRHVFCYPDSNSNIIKEWSQPDKWEQENGKIRWYMKNINIVWDNLYSWNDYSIAELNKYFAENNINAVVKEKTDSDINYYGEYKYILKKKANFDKTPIESLLKMKNELGFSYIENIPVSQGGTIVYANDKPVETTAPVITESVTTTSVIATVTDIETIPVVTEASTDGNTAETNAPVSTSPSETTTVTTVVTDTPKVILGDADSDNQLNVRDCSFIANALANGKGDELPDSADYNKDGNKNIRDAALIARELASAK